MAQSHYVRKAFTLVELIVVIAVIAILVGMILPAIQMVREAASKIDSSNRLRQINLAAQSYAAQNNNLLPLFAQLPVQNSTWGDRYGSVMPHLALHMESGLPDPKQHDFPPGVAERLFQSPADPTLELSREGDCSYAANAILFSNDAGSLRSASDGLSNTIAFVEHCANCRNQTGRTVKFGYTQSDVHCSDNFGNRVVPCTDPPWHRPSFADRSFDDLIPANRPESTFQERPEIGRCDYRLPQTPHRSGMLIGLADGSVGVISTSVKSEIFWATVTQAGGEVVRIS